ncbi:MAG TPA: ATPase [Acidimicrobiia bacterium]|nr:ATPase [Acidimicrobiia bacterium]HIL04805.1 ATPase [Acidimicrobiia bacterium]
MATLAELTRIGTDLSTQQLMHLQRLVAWWGILADLSFSDLLLFVPTDEVGTEFAIAGQIRPTTGQTLYRDDHVGLRVDDIDRPLVARAFALGEVVEGEVPIKPTNRRARVMCIPITHDGVVVGVLSRELVPDFAERRDPGELERTYLQTFHQLAKMIASGVFPFVGHDVDMDEVPRVGDGLLVVDREARIQYASPNALSTLHRIGIVGNVAGRRLGDLGIEQPIIRQAMKNFGPITAEVERNDTAVQVLAMPLIDREISTGAVVLLRDITELRLRDRLLVSKDATIREIHHRVKNNLQTISSLLRVQGRRLESVEAKSAIDESVRRIRAIALVHETLASESSDDVSLAEVANMLARTVQDSFTSPERPIRFEVHGDAGLVPSDVVTRLAVVLNELLQNTVDHAFPDDLLLVEGRVCLVEILLSRDAEHIRMMVRDNGVGVPDDFDSSSQGGLGVSIVRALATSELGGEIVMRRRSDSAGSEVLIEVPLTDD